MDVKNEDEIELLLHVTANVSLDDIASGFKSCESKVDFLHGLFCLLKEHECGPFLEKCNETDIVSDWVIENQADPDYYLVYIPREMPKLIDEVKKKIATETNGELYSLYDTE